MYLVTQSVFGVQLESSGSLRSSEGSLRHSLDPFRLNTQPKSPICWIRNSLTLKCRYDPLFPFSELVWWWFRLLFYKAVRNGNEREEGPWPVLSNKSGICLEGLSKVTRLPSEESEHIRSFCYSLYHYMITSVLGYS